ncbi:MAG: hypothetical protein NT108_00950 [Candidatus Kaiserbacteria bacterium]|nr:hypothetical protein [Candidatus Kaiserbacteria bacterium]
MKQNITLITIALILAAGAYWYFFTDTGNELPLTANTTENPAQVRFRALILRLPTSFNTGILSDARFNSLVDLTTQISPESVGRIDPFAPIQGIGGK